MSDPTVDKVKFRGNAAIWTYGESRNFPGWHFCCDAEAAHSLLTLIKAMRAARWPARKTIPLVRNLHLTRATGHHRRPKFARSLEIRFKKENPPSHWSFTQTNNALLLELGEESLTDFERGIVNITRGEGDYDIGGEPPLWFWWEVRKR